MTINRLKTGVELIDEMSRISNISQKWLLPCIILVNTSTSFATYRELKFKCEFAWRKNFIILN